MVAIGGTLYCHDKYLVARGSLSIATLNIVVAIGASVYCHGKCLVAIGGNQGGSSTTVWSTGIGPV